MITSHIVDKSVQPSPQESAGRFRHPDGSEYRRDRTLDSRTAVRYLTAVLSMAVGAFYLILLFLVFNAEAQPDAVVTDTTYGAYLLLAIPYLIGAVLAVVTDRRMLWVVGAGLQVLVIALFAVFGVGAFEYQALSELRMEVWAAVITAAQVTLLCLLGYLAITDRH